MLFKDIISSVDGIPQKDMGNEYEWWFREDLKGDGCRLLEALYLTLTRGAMN
jgi:hypothetical protein